MAKKIVRKDGWQRKDWFLGIEFSLAALSTAFVHLFTLAEKMGGPPSSAEVEEISLQLIYTLGLTVLMFFLLLVVLSIHQDWEKRDDKVWSQIAYLAIVSNFIGASLMFVISWIVIAA